MELVGDLVRQKLPDLLQGLAAFRQDGVLEVTDPGGLRAEIGLAAGGVSWARLRHWRGEEALLACLFWREGSYRFRGGVAEGPEDARLPEGWNLTAFLLEAVYLADELEKHRRLVPPPAAPLALQQPFSGEDPFGCGVDRVVAALEGAGPVTLQHLEETLPLAPVKVRLAVAYLVEQGCLPPFPTKPRSESSDRYSSWWTRLHARYRGRFRLLVLVDGVFTNLESFSQVVAFLAKKLNTPDPWVSFSPKGPSFARLKGTEGGVLSLTFISCEAADDMDLVGLGIGQNWVVGVGSRAQKCLTKLQSLGVPTAGFATVDELLGGLAYIE